MPKMVDSAMTPTTTSINKDVHVVTQLRQGGGKVR